MGTQGELVHFAALQVPAGRQEFRGDSLIISTPQATAAS
jgi:hypothetical protein